MKSRGVLRIVGALWLVWGLVHAFAGAITIARDTPEAVGGIADAVDPATLDAAYAPAVGAIVNQHGFNLLWIGLVTMACAIAIWRAFMPAAGLAALVGGLADVGYFLFLDLGGHVRFVPGTVMTIFSATAIALSAWAWRAGSRASAAG